MNSLRHPSDDDALLALGSPAAQECSTSSILEDLSHTLTGTGGAFEVVASADLLSDCHTLCFCVSSKRGLDKLNATDLFRGHRTLVGLPEFLDSLGVTSQVLLAANKDDGQTGAKVHDLRDPLHRRSVKLNTFAQVHTARREARITYLLLNVIQTVRAVNREADEDDV